MSPPSPKATVTLDHPESVYIAQQQSGDLPSRNRLRRAFLGSGGARGERVLRGVQESKTLLAAHDGGGIHAPWPPADFSHACGRAGCGVLVCYILHWMRVVNPMKSHSSRKNHRNSIARSPLKPVFLKHNSADSLDPLQNGRIR